MYPDWYSNQYHQYNDSFNSEWEIFGIIASASDGKVGPRVPLSSPEILGWLDSTVDINSQTTIKNSRHGSLCMIFTRHREHKSYEIKPWYLAFSREVFKQILQKMKLPTAYPFMRMNAGASGNFAKFSSFREDGTLSHLSFAIRVPHSPRTTAKAIWSLATSWDANTRNTSALFESASNDDMKEVEDYLSGRPKERQHPLCLPVMLLDLLIIFYVDHRRKLEHSLFVVESQLGITRGQRKTDAWDWDYALHRDTTKRCNTVYTSLVYLERQLDFVTRLGDFLLQSLEYCVVEEIFHHGQQPCLKLISKMLKESVFNNQNFAKCQLHQVLCLQKRTQALVSVIYTVVAQKDSRTNVSIATAAKRDSSSMTAIALLGVIFLPAMFIATLFSTSMFDFSPPSSSGSSTSNSVIVSSKFWVFWVVTIPLTLVVLTIWRLWMRKVQGKKWKLEDESMKEETSAYRGITSIAYQDPRIQLRDTPLYPRHGYQHLDSGKGKM